MYIPIKTHKSTLTDTASVWWPNKASQAVALVSSPPPTSCVFPTFLIYAAFFGSCKLNVKCTTLMYVSNKYITNQWLKVMTL